MRVSILVLEGQLQGPENGVHGAAEEERQAAAVLHLADDHGRLHMLRRFRYVTPRRAHERGQGAIRRRRLLRHGQQLFEHRWSRSWLRGSAQCETAAAGAVSGARAGLNGRSRWRG